MNLKDKLSALAFADTAMLLEKGETYGDSWKKRGGVGAAMMLARKWDRIEKALEQHNYDIFEAIQAVDYLTDDIQDLGCYLWLVRSEGMTDEGEEPGPGYVDQDEPDPWREMAYNEARQRKLMKGAKKVVENEEVLNKALAPGLLAIGDTELRRFYQLSESEFSSIDLEQRHYLIIELRQHYNSMRLGRDPNPPLSTIMMPYREWIRSYFSPQQGQKITLPRPGAPA